MDAHKPTGQLVESQAQNSLHKVVMYHHQLSHCCAFCWALWCTGVVSTGAAASTAASCSVVPAIIVGDAFMVCNSFLGTPNMVSLIHGLTPKAERAPLLYSS